MTNLEETSGPAASPEVAQRWLPALLLLFVGSGCAALIYEVVWFQLLQLSIGSSAVSLGVLLGIYMGGMCLGSLLLPRYLNPSWHPLRVYAALEAGIGVFGVIVLFAVPIVGQIYTQIAGTGQANLFLRAIVASICLLPPTLLMGATLPAIARWVETTPRGVSWLGYFYGGNLAGAVAGSLLAGFYLLRVYDMPTATAVAVVLNLVVAGLAMLVATRTPHTVITADASAPLPQPISAESARLVYIAIALSGSDRARLRSRVDASAFAALRRDDVHVLADPGRVPGRVSESAAASARRSRAACRTRRRRSDGCSLVCASASRGRRIRQRTHCRSGRSIHRSRRRRRSPSSSI